MRITWLDLNASYSHSSLALPALQAQLIDRTERGEIEWSVVSATLHTPVSECVNQLAATSPDLICATAWLFTHDLLRLILIRLNVLRPQTRIWLGGPEFLGDNQTYLAQNRWATALFKGEAEEIFPRWLRHFDQPEAWKTLDGICFIDHQGHYHEGKRAEVRHFAALVPPHQSPYFPIDKPFVQLETNRGCYNTCAFCVSGNGQKLQYLPLRQIRQALDYFVRCGIKEIRLLDRTFNASPRRAVEMLDLFADYHGRLAFHLEIHPALLTPPIRQKLSTLPRGLLHLEAGIQSLDQTVIDQSGRKGNVADTRSGLEFLVAQSNFETHVDLIAGLPHYTYAQVVRDVRQLIALHTAEIQLELLKLLPGTTFQRQAQNLGLRHSPLPPYEILATDHITPEELSRCVRLSKLLDIYYNDPVWQQLFRQVTVENQPFLEEFLGYANQQHLFDQPSGKERRGALLFDFLHLCLPRYTSSMAQTWLRGGLSLHNMPYSTVQNASEIEKHRLLTPPELQDPSVRLYKITLDQTHFWIQYNRSIQQSLPIKIYTS